MNCPVCSSELAPVRAGDVTVDVCASGCGGIWFDNFELRKLDEPGETAADLLIKVTAGKRPPPADDSKRHCPKCGEIQMMRHFFSPHQRVEVDECPNCAGFWLDAGELALIRSEHDREQQRRAAIEDYFEEAGRLQTEAMEKGGAEQIARARRISQIFRFASPFRYRTAED